jgi:hypothetical protein
VVAACALLAVAASAQTWVQRSTPVAPVAGGHALSYDALRQRTVLFGGRHAWVDTWEWDGRAWHAMASTRFPAPRSDFPMVFDRTRGVNLVFGGQLSVSLTDETWEWDGSTWQQRFPASSPSRRYAHAMAYDSARGRVVLFGGFDSNNPYLSDTWEWDGNSWLRRTAPGPAGKGHHAMAYDAARQRTVMFGGRTGAGVGPLGDTWEWDGNAWTQRTPVQSAFVRQYHRMVFDADRARVVLFGGNAREGGPGLAETWEWDGTSWSQLHAAATPPGSFGIGCDMVYDEARGRTVAVGGADTWELVATTATATPFGTGCGSPALTVAPAANSRPLLGATQVTDVTNVPAGGGLMALGLSRTALGPVALPLALDPFGLAGCTLYQDNLVPGVPCTPTAAGAAQHRIAIPNDLDLAGAHVYLQAWAPAPGANPAGVVFSNAVDLLLGNM